MSKFVAKLNLSQARRFSNGPNSSGAPFNPRFSREGRSGTPFGGGERGAPSGGGGGFGGGGGGAPGGGFLGGGPYRARRPPVPRGDAPARGFTMDTVGKQVEGFTLRNDPDYRVFLAYRGDTRISPWHDIHLVPSRFRSFNPRINPKNSLVYSYVCEIPKNTTAKMEIATKEPMNPIKQDIKKEKLRDYPFSSIVNYGALPQTWEDPNFKDPATGLGGDNDPIDVVEIGARVGVTGEIRNVKVLGVLGMMDEGEMDWKVLALDINSEYSDQLNTPADVERFFPGKLKSIVDWFRVYKVPDGKPQNQFAFNGEWRDAEFAQQVIAHAHAAWRDNKEGMKAAGLWVPDKLVLPPPTPFVPREGGGGGGEGRESRADFRNGPPREFRERRERRHQGGSDSPEDDNSRGGGSSSGGEKH